LLEFKCSELFRLSIYKAGREPTLYWW